MIHFFINAAAASAGGGLTYVRNFAAQLLGRDDARATLLVSPQARRALGQVSLIVKSSRVEFLDYETANAGRRFWREQFELPRLIRRSGAHVLLSTGNFALRNSPIPQILLSRNALYTSKTFFHDLLARGEHLLWITEHCKRFLAELSITWADCTIAPSQAFARQLTARTGRDVITVHHGFDRDTFFETKTAPPALQAKLETAEGCIRLLYVSHYNYYRNFETLLRAIPLMRQQLAPIPVRLFLTCELRTEMNPGSYRAETAAALVQELGIRDEVIELGAIPYESLHHIYKACNVYVTSAYAESFAHPLVEAMASGLPIVASDLAVHREICQDAALTFSTFDSEDLARKVIEVVRSPAIGKQLTTAGLRRSGDFSWRRHVDQVISIAQELVTAQSLESAVTDTSEEHAQASV